MVKRAGFLAENLVGIAFGLGVVVILVLLWVADASRRTHQIEGMVKCADLNGATFYLPLVVVPAHRIGVSRGVNHVDTAWEARITLNVSAVSK